MSSDNRIFVELSGKESKLLDMMREFNTQVDEAAVALAKERKEMAALEREAQRVIKGITTDQEKYNQTIERLNLMREKGKLTEEQYGKAAKKSHDDIFGSAKRMPPLWQEIAGGVTVASVAVSGLHAAQRFIVEALEKEVELRKESVRLLQESIRAAGPGAQLGNPQFGALQRRLFASGAAGTMTESADLAFSMMSGGLESEESTITRMSTTNFVKDVTAITNSFDTFKNAMGESETGSFKDVLSKMLVAAGPVVGEMDQMFEEATKSAQSAKQLGISDEELLASIATVAKSGGLKIAGQRMNAFYRALTEKDEFEGMGTQAIIKSIQAKGMSDGELQKYLGSSEASQGYGILANKQDEYGAYLNKITAAPGAGVFEQRLSTQEKNADVQAVSTLRQSQNQFQLENMDRSGRVQTLLEAARSQRARKLRASGDWVGARIEESMNWIGDKFMSPTTALDYELSNERRNTQGGLLDPKLESQIVDELKRQTNLMNKQNKAAPSAVPAVEK